MPRRPTPKSVVPKRTSVKSVVQHAGRSLKRFDKKYKAVKKLKKYGPGAAAAGLVLGGTAASIYTGNPLPGMAASMASDFISKSGKKKKKADWHPSKETVQEGQSIYDKVKEQQARERNNQAGSVSSTPTGSKTKPSGAQAAKWAQLVANTDWDEEDEE